MSTTSVFLTRMPSGIPGAVTRAEHATIVPEVYAASNYPTLFGSPVKYSSGKIVKFTGSEAIADMAGWLVRPYPSMYTSSEAISTSTPNPTQIANVLKRGYMTVLLSFGTAAKGAQVYVCVATTGGHVVGTIGDSSDSSYCIAVAGCYFMGAADADGNVEISYNVER
jgi:hypothetical protein